VTGASGTSNTMKFLHWAISVFTELFWSGNTQEFDWTFNLDSGMLISLVTDSDR
jgi:hypothetical protein